MLDEQKFLGNVPPAGEQLTRLEFLNCVIKESMRVLPPVPYTVRATESEVWLGPYYLPHGARVILSHYLTHHLPELYSGPEKFRPERWREIDPNQCEYMPFNAGRVSASGRLSRPRC